MTRVRVDLMISIDGFATTTDQTPENPFGDDWSRLVEHYAATSTFRERVFGDTTGEGIDRCRRRFRQPSTSRASARRSWARASSVFTPFRMIPTGRGGGAMIRRSRARLRAHAYAPAVDTHGRRHNLPLPLRLTHRGTCCCRGCRGRQRRQGRWRADNGARVPTPDSSTTCMSRSRRSCWPRHPPLGRPSRLDRDYTVTSSRRPAAPPT